MRGMNKTITVDVTREITGSSHPSVPTKANNTVISSTRWRRRERERERGELGWIWRAVSGPFTSALRRGGLGGQVQGQGENGRASCINNAVFWGCE